MDDAYMFQKVKRVKDSEPDLRRPQRVEMVT